MKIPKKRSISRRTYKRRTLVITGGVLIVFSLSLLFTAVMSQIVANNLQVITNGNGVVGEDGASISRAFDAVLAEQRKAAEAATKNQQFAAAPPVIQPQVEGATTSCKPNTTASKKYAISQSPMIQKYAEYVALCGEGTAKRLMFFAGMPGAVGDIPEMTQDMAVALKTFAAVGLAPLVIVEPIANNQKIDLQTIKEGTYNSLFDQYFAALKQKGITDAQMGMWVPFPENNLPEWGNVDPDTFAANVTTYVGYQKKYFPASQASIMLDPMTYKPTASGFDDGSYISLSPWVKNIPKGLINSFGMQGFPWASAANDASHETNESADVFLPSGLAAEAAKLLGVSKIWLNTGTFSDRYTDSASAKIHRSAAQRLQTFTTTARQVALLQAKGFSVSVNLFNQDKSNADEAVNWSYWPAGQPGAADSNVFISFTDVLRKNGIDLWLFDVK